MLIREAEKSDAAGIAKVQIDTWRTTYRGIVPDDYINSLSCENKQHYWRQYLASDDSRFAFVAENEETQIVGFAAGGKNREERREEYAGELYTLYLLENYQGRGIGRRLVNFSAQRLLQQNIFSMLVWVLGENPFRVFYESLGGEFVAERFIVIGGASLVDAAYGWKNLKLLSEK